jgi:hypothetical protein
MSWFDDVVDVGKSLLGGVGNILTGGGLGGSVAKAALLGLALNKLTGSITRGNAPAPRPVTAEVDRGVRLQVNPSTEEKIPVLYGSATMGGIMTEAVLSNDNQTMFYVFTLAERTGNLLSTTNSSTYVFNDVYLNDNRVIFQSNGITADYMIDREGNQDISVRGLVNVYCYAGNSELPQVPEYYTNPSLLDAYDIVPNWTPQHMMSDLLFAVVRLDYARDKGVNRVPDMKFTITNSMSLPGDCIFDYMTNTRYGAGIASTDILTS